MTTHCHCPLCGQRMLVRHGVAFPPFKAEFLDMIERASTRGITAEVLAGVFYPGKATKMALRCVYQHVNQINGLLASTDVLIVNTMVGHRSSLYRVATAKSGTIRLSGIGHERRGSAGGRRR